MSATTSRRTSSWLTYRNTIITWVFMPKLRITGKHHQIPKLYKYLRRERQTWTIKTGSTKTPSGKRTWGWLRRPAASLTLGYRNHRRCRRVWHTNSSCTIWRTTLKSKSSRSKNQLSKTLKRSWLDKTASNTEFATHYSMTLIPSRTLRATWSRSNNRLMILPRINQYLVKICKKE